MNPGPSVPLAYYNTGQTSGMNSGTTYSSALAQGSNSPAAQRAGATGGSANLYLGGLVAGALVIIVLFHFLGFRFAFDVDVGRRG
jgi:hypothetical protein